jgi:hypothetical protein
MSDDMTCPYCHPIEIQDQTVSLDGMNTEKFFSVALEMLKDGPISIVNGQGHKVARIVPVVKG